MPKELSLKSFSLVEFTFKHWEPVPIVKQFMWPLVYGQLANYLFSEIESLTHFAIGFNTPYLLLVIDGRIVNQHTTVISKTQTMCPSGVHLICSFVTLDVVKFHDYVEASPGTITVK